MNPEELDLVETNDLVAALARRHTCTIFGWTKDLDGQREQRCFRWFGSPTMAAGLLHYGTVKLALRAEGTGDAPRPQDDL